MPITVFDVKGIPAHRRDHIDAAVRGTRQEAYTRLPLLEPLTSVNSGDYRFVTSSIVAKATESLRQGRIRCSKHYPNPLNVSGTP